MSISPVSTGHSHGTPQVTEKTEADVEINNVIADSDSDYYRAENGEESHSTAADARDMQRMGKRQQLVRNFHFFTIAAFTSIATGAWELGIFLVTPSLVDGGLPAMLYGLLWCFFAFGPVYLSIAEMTSMAPIAGAQYHWVSEFAPRRYQRILSYLSGWSSTLALQAGNALGCFLSGTLVQATISVMEPDYEAPSWQGTLLVMAAISVALAGNVFGATILHKWQLVVFIIHVAGYLIFLIPIWVKSPAISHQQVWLDFQNNGGWSTMALSILVGQLTPISNQVGIDTAAHMGEDVQDAGRQIPKAIMFVWVFNFVITFPTFLTLAYHIPSIEDALADITTYPAIYVLRQVWSPAGIVGFLVLTNILLIAGNIAYMAAVTRDLFAFSRDKGVPFSGWLSRIDKKRAVPVNAALITSTFSTGLSLIYIGSPVAFYAITSLCTVALLQCYCLSIGCVLWRRIYHPETLPPAAFSLGRWGIPINIAAVIVSLWSFFWCFWPQVTPITAADFNWASVLFVLVLIVAMVDFVFRGRKAYFGPVTSVEGRKVQ